MGSLGVTVNVADLINFFEGKVSNLPEYTTVLVDGIGEDVREEMVDEAPYITGDLRQGHVSESVGDYVRVIFSDVPHFDWVVGGTRPHWIRPIGTSTYMGQTIREGSGKNYLWWPGADHPVREVYHPGTQPNDYPLRALENAQPKIDNRINDFLNNITGA